VDDFLFRYRVHLRNKGYVDSGTVKEISEEEGDKPLIPSSTVLAWTVQLNTQDCAV